MKSRSGDREVVKNFVQSHGCTECHGLGCSFCRSSGSRLQGITAAQFGSITEAIDYAFDQPAVLEVLARGMGPNAMTCQHLATSIRAGHDSCKPETVRAVAHLCGDLARNKQLILAELSEFEIFLCHDALTVKDL
mmetsp:Transcript_42082/g.65826  ORF Transcript_42082/g.65826 Transcript_42082/m.65826 type:complete len:135 (-) Transcript_42082:14-418(-)